MDRGLFATAPAPDVHRVASTFIHAGSPLSQNSFTHGSAHN
jgi:hypothetical protein